MSKQDDLYQSICKKDLDQVVELLYEDDPKSPYHQFRKFQRQVVRVANQMTHTMVAAPSQSGKSTALLAFHIPTLFKKDGLSMIVTNSLDNAQELYEDFVKYILGDEKLQKDLHALSPNSRRKDGIGLKEFTKIKSKTSGKFIMTSPLGAQFWFLPATESALAGKSPDRITLDEVAIWQNSLARKIYNEAFARIGQTHGKILSVSTVREGGECVVLPDGQHELSGNLFFSQLRRIERLQKRLPPEKWTEFALTYTYHASEKLKQLYPDSPLDKQGRKYHYWSIPMENPDKLMFAPYFDRTRHVVTESDLERKVPETRTGNTRWCLSFDVGIRSAAVMIQYLYNLSYGPPCKIIVWDVFRNEPEETVYDFAKRIYHYCRQKYPIEQSDFLLTGDIASGHRGQGIPYKAQIEAATGRTMMTKKQRIQEGCELMRNYMTEPTAFYILAHNSSLIYALEKGLKHQTDTFGLKVDAYVKDGIYDHETDAFRYGVVNVTYGAIPQQQRQAQLPMIIRSPYD